MIIKANAFVQNSFTEPDVNSSFVITFLDIKDTGIGKRETWMQRIFIHRCQNQAFYSVHLSDVYSTHTYIRIEYQRMPFGLGRDEMGREEGVNPQPQLPFSTRSPK